MPSIARPSITLLAAFWVAAVPRAARSTDRCVAEIGRQLARLAAVDVRDALHGTSPAASIDGRRLRRACPALPASIGYTGCPGVGGCPVDTDTGVSGFGACLTCAARAAAHAIASSSQPARCGDGQVDEVTEQCEHDVDCAQGLHCVPPGAADQCQCARPERFCGDGTRADYEECDGSAMPSGCTAGICRDCRCECPANPNGGPRAMRLVTANAGTDFDLGWTGVMHGARLPSGGANVLCVDGCDASGGTICSVGGPPHGAGEGFAAPLPLLAANVPLCLVGRFTATAGGTVGLATGEVHLTLPLEVDVHLTSPTAVCPRCRAQGGTGTNRICDSGAHMGQPCTIDGVIPALGVVAGELQVSHNCPPSPTTRVMTVTLPLSLTTAVAGPLAGGASLPCGSGVGVKDDNCQGSVCGSTCTGDACVGLDAAGRCVDVKGGLSQTCCGGGHSDRPCFPLGFTRTGSGLVLTSLLTDSAWPKSGAMTLAAVYCQSAVGAVVVDAAAGLPGPAAVVLPLSVELMR